MVSVQLEVWSFYQTAVPFNSACAPPSAAIGLETAHQHQVTFSTFDWLLQKTGGSILGPLALLFTQPQNPFALIVYEKYV